MSSTGPSPSAPDSSLRVTGLRCEHAIDPPGVDVPAPRLSWQLAGEQRGERQTAWQVVVASSAARLEPQHADLWDSGRVESSQTTDVSYGGNPLQSSQRLFWRVRAWARNGASSAWSEPATWTMGLLDPAEWRGVWIVAPGETEALLLRHEFVVRPGLVRAVAHVCGLGQYEMRLNGRRVGDDLLSPGWTNYHKTVLYDTREVTCLLREGPNAVGLVLGNGTYHVVRRNRFAKFTGSFGPLRAILHLRLEYGDGAVDFVSTDDTWQVHPGAITYNSIYGGEDVDARLEQHGWDEPGFDARQWRRAVPLLKPAGTLRGHSHGADPIRAIEVRPAVRVIPLPDRSVVYDFGQNASFMPRLRIAGPAGATLRLTPAEVINHDGTLNRSTMGNPTRGLSWWQYTKSSDEAETWFPRFFYVGSRYLHAQWIAPDDGPVREGQVDSLEMVIVHSSAAPVGHFAASDPLLNRIRNLVRWAQRSNLVSILTDCPHREKLGWLEQNHLNGPSLRYEFDLARLFAKNVRDMADAQDRDGLVPNVAPEYVRFDGSFRAAAEWGAAFIAVPWQQYVFTGDVQLLREHYEAMKRYFAYLQSRAVDEVLSEGLGDWYDLGAKKPGATQLTPPPVTATALYFQDATLLSRIAAVLDEKIDADTFAASAQRIRETYNRVFFDVARGVYGTGSQSSLAIPLALGIVDPTQRPRVLAALLRELERCEYATTCGNVGFGYLLRALADAGRSDLVYRMLRQEDRPGYAWQLKRGETSLTESWDANLGSSHNHFMFGQVIEWFYHDLAGIRPDPQSPGFRHVIFCPQPVDELAWVEASYASAAGPIRSRWEQGGDRFLLDVSVPANASATVWLPTRGMAEVREGGESVERRPGVRMLRQEVDRVVLAIESGRYVFETRGT